MWSLLRTRRWIAFTLLVIFAIGGFGLLSRWQWDRAEDRRVEKQALVAESTQALVPVADVDLSEPVEAWEWRPVEATGNYLDEATLLVRQRPLDGRNGLWVVSPLRTDSGPIVWVNRGWIQAIGGSTSVVVAPPAPTGEVTVTGRLRPLEAGRGERPADLPDGQVATIDADTLAAAVSSSAYPAYVEQISSVPADADVTSLPLPVIDEGRNVSYAVQWLLFAGVAMVGWFFFLRREAREDRELAWTSD